MLWPLHSAFSYLTWGGPCVGISALRNNPCLCLLHHAGPEHGHITAAPQLSLFVYLIYWRMPRRNRCCVLVPLFYFTPAQKKKVDCSPTELSACIIVIYINLTFHLSFAFTVFLRKRKRHRKGKKNECGSGGLTPTTDQKHENVFEHRYFSIPLSLLSDFCWTVLSL